MMSYISFLILKGTAKNDVGKYTCTIVDVVKTGGFIFIGTQCTRFYFLFMLCNNCDLYLVCAASTHWHWAKS